MFLVHVQTLDGEREKGRNDIKIDIYVNTCLMRPFFRGPRQITASSLLGNMNPTLMTNNYIQEKTNTIKK
jgi:hypothetical protein